jgi:hypothetical protein
MEDAKAERSIPPWWGFTALGGVLLLAACVPGWAPNGPWGDESFTRGVFGLIGCYFLYRAWYRATFGRDGIMLPPVESWQDAPRAIRILTALGIVSVIASRLIGTKASFLPKPTALLVILFGLLLLLLALYAWMVSAGPLVGSDEEE